MPDVDETEQPERMCASCGQRPPGPGGVLCPECNVRIAQARPFYLDDITAAADTAEDPATAQARD